MLLYYCISGSFINGFILLVLLCLLGFGSFVFVRVLLFASVFSFGLLPLSSLSGGASA